jgi:uncharacterized protein (DUF1697 family)
MSSRASVMVALLRGVNVGGKRVAMSDLKALVEGLGHRDVRTLLNSGNVIFTPAPRTTPAAATARIEKAITDELGLSVRVTVLTAAELAAIVAGNPLAAVADNPSRLMVSVPTTAADLQRLAPLAQTRWEPEALALGERAAYVWCPAGIIESAVMKELARVLRDDVTTRNWATMGKLHALTAGR